MLKKNELVIALLVLLTVGVTLVACGSGGSATSETASTTNDANPSDSSGDSGSSGESERPWVGSWLLTKKTANGVTLDVSSYGVTYTISADRFTYRHAFGSCGGEADLTIDASTLRATVDVTTSTCPNEILEPVAFQFAFPSSGVMTWELLKSTATDSAGTVNTYERQ